MTSPTWNMQEPPAAPKIGVTGLLRIVLRGPLLAVLVFGGLLLHMGLRLPEWLLLGRKRPVTAHVAQFVSRNALRIMGIGYAVQGEPMRGRGVVVANHSSWLDIFVLNASQRITFVSKAEVAKWPGIGWLARATGTVFIERDRRQAQLHTQIFRDRIAAGDHLLFFPEGTSTDGQRVLPFKTTLFAAFMEMPELEIQPVSVEYEPPQGADPRFYGWWGDMDFGSSLLQMLAASRHGRVTVTCHPPRRVDEAENRKALAALLEADVRQGAKLG